MRFAGRLEKLRWQLKINLCGRSSVFHCFMSFKSREMGEASLHLIGMNGFSPNADNKRFAAAGYVRISSLKPKGVQPDYFFLVQPIISLISRCRQRWRLNLYIMGFVENTLNRRLSYTEVWSCVSDWGEGYASPFFVLIHLSVVLWSHDVKWKERQLSR